MNNTLRIARKEFAGFFSSPIAFIFLGAFLALTLFIFFWVETFFARNIADVRPLFEWMPVLLGVLLVIYLTSLAGVFLFGGEVEHGLGELVAATLDRSGVASPVTAVLLNFRDHVR